MVIVIKNMHVFGELSWRVELVHVYETVWRGNFFVVVRMGSHHNWNNIVSTKNRIVNVEEYEVNYQKYRQPIPDSLNTSILRATPVVIIFICQTIIQSIVKNILSDNTVCRTKVTNMISYILRTKICKK